MALSMNKKIAHMLEYPECFKNVDAAVPCLRYMF